MQTNIYVPLQHIIQNTFENFKLKNEELSLCYIAAGHIIKSTTSK